MLVQYCIDTGALHPLVESFKEAIAKDWFVDPTDLTYITILDLLRLVGASSC